MGRTGKRWEIYRACEQGKYVAIGWNELGDLNWLLTEKLNEEEAKEKLLELYTKKLRSWHENETQKRINVGQVYRFVKEIKTGDFVLSPTAKRTVVIGKIASDYFPALKQKDNCRYKQRREVRWTIEIPRDEMAQGTCG